MQHKSRQLLRQPQIRPVFHFPIVSFDPGVFTHDKTSMLANVCTPRQLSRTHVNSQWINMWRPKNSHFLYHHRQFISFVSGVSAVWFPPIPREISCPPHIFQITSMFIHIIGIVLTIFLKMIMISIRYEESYVQQLDQWEKGHRSQHWLGSLEKDQPTGKFRSTLQA